MAYSSTSGRRPIEYASKSAHHHFINDSEVQALLADCWIPAEADEIELDEASLAGRPPPLEHTGIRAIVCIDGGYTETIVRARYPSVRVCFFQFGALTFSVDDLRALEKQAFLRPEDMAKLKELKRLKLALPLSNLRLNNAPSFRESVRRTIFRFFVQTKIDETSLADTLAWLLFERYRGPRARTEWHLSSNPLSPAATSAELRLRDMTAAYTFPCPETGGQLFLTDVLRLHERVDEETGAGGILGYLSAAIEQVLLVHLVRMVSRRDRSVLSKILFIRDGPLAFAGTTARLNAAMRALVAHLHAERIDLRLMGVEKSGAFVDHAVQIKDRLPDGRALLLSNSYIYRYILPPTVDAERAYGDTSLYGHKLIYKTSLGQVHVISLPALEQRSRPEPSDYLGLDQALAAVEALHCHKYDNALVPVALANQLVSLAAHPSQRILQQFAASIIGAADRP